MQGKFFKKTETLLETISSTLFHSGAISVWLIAALIMAVQFSHISVLIIVIPCVIGAYIFGNRISSLHLKHLAVVLIGFASFLVICLISYLINVFPYIPLLFGSKPTYILTEMLVWGAGAFIIVSVLRFLSMQKAQNLIYEAIVIVLAISSPFWAHRFGYINRPVPIIDKTWVYGIDPKWVFLFIGFCIILLLFFVLSNRKDSKKSIFDFFLYFILLIIMLISIPFSKIENLAMRGGANPQATGTPRPTPQGGQQNQGDQNKDDKNNNDTKMQNQMAQGSNAPVAVVNLHDDYRSLDGYYYFRQDAFSQYNGIRLVKDTTGLADKDILDQFPTKKITIDLPDVDKLNNYRYLETTVAMIAKHTKPFGLVNPQMFQPMENKDPQRFDRIYMVGSYVRAKPYEDVLIKGVGSKKWDNKLWKHYTDAPDDPRYLKLAKEIILEINPKFRDNPIVQAIAIKMWLDENCIYSLKCEHGNSPDPTASFLFGDRTGYCVYTAHSTAYLLRSIGIPSRVCGGYAVDERFRGGSSSILILDKYSHLWPEFYIDGLGWVNIDISPKRSLEPPVDAPDQNLQQMMGDMAKNSSGNPENKKIPKPAIKIDLKPIFWALFMLILIGFLILYIIKLSRKMAVYCCSEQNLPKIAYRGALDELIDCGLKRDFGMPRKTFAKNLNEITPSFTNLTELHLQNYYKKGNISGISKRNILDLYNKTRKEISKNTPFFKKLKGAFNPFSWLFTK